MAERADIALMLTDRDAKPWEFPEPPVPLPRPFGQRIGDLADRARSYQPQTPAGMPFGTMTPQEEVAQTESAQHTLADLLVPSTATEVGMAAYPPMRMAGKVIQKLKAVPTAIGALLDYGGGEAEAGRIKGITHAISNTVLPHHPREFQQTIEQTKKIPQRGIRPEDFEEGSLLTWLIGDRSASGKRITHLGDKPLREPTQLQGGYEYIPEWNVGWASTPPVTTTLANRFQPYLDEGRKVYGVYTAMHPQAVGGSKMTTKTILNAMPEKLPRDELDAFNNYIKAVYPDTPRLGAAPHSKRGYTPITQQSVDQLLEHLNKASITERRHFTDVMAMAPLQRAGFPNIPHVRTAVTHPDLLNAPSYQSGHAIAELTGGSAKAPKLGPHADYEGKLFGRNVGRFEHSLPIGDVFPDFWKYATNRLAPEYQFKALQTGLKGQVPGQIVTPKWIDQASKALERRKRRMGDLAAEDYYR